MHEFVSVGRQRAFRSSSNRAFSACLQLPQAVHTYISLHGAWHDDCVMVGFDAHKKSSPSQKSSQPWSHLHPRVSGMRQDSSDAAVSLSRLEHARSTSVDQGLGHYFNFGNSFNVNSLPT